MDIKVAALKCGIIARIFGKLFINCKPLIPVQFCRKTEVYCKALLPILLVLLF